MTHNKQDLITDILIWATAVGNWRFVKSLTAYRVLLEGSDIEELIAEREKFKAEE